MMLIGVAALALYWFGGWAIVFFLNNYGFSCLCYDQAIRCCIPFGTARIPFWPVSSLFLLIVHGIFMFRFSRLSGSLGVPTRHFGGSYDAELDNPFAKLVAKDLTVVGLLLMLFLILSSCNRYGWFCW